MDAFIPDEWATTAEWPIRVKLGSHSVHAAAMFMVLSYGWKGRRWTACGKRQGEHATDMPAGWTVTCRACRKALARTEPTA